MAIYDLWLSRNGAPVTAANYIGHKGRLFYDDTNGVLRRSDGVTPGGIPIPITTATSTVAGGIKLGPGTTLNQQGQLIIDPEGLDFAFGDFAALTETYPVGHPKAGDDYAILQTINDDEDAVIASNGTGGIKVVGNFQVYAPDGTVNGALMVPPVFTIGNDGQTKIIVPSTDPQTGAVEIIGSLSGASQSTVNTGVMLHITGNNGDASRIYNDGIGSFAAYVARRYNGSASTATAVLANEEIMRISGTAHNGTSIPGTGNQRIVYRALGNQTPTNQGGSIELWTTPLNTTTLAKVATVDGVGVTLESGKAFTGNLIGNVSATAVTATNFVGTVVTPAQPNITSVGTLTNLSVAGTASATTGTFTKFSGKWIRNTRNAGTIGAGGTLTIDFATDGLVYCTWSTGLVMAYQNYTPGSVVRVIATKATASGNGPISLDGVTAANVSNGSTTTGNYNPDTTAFLEFTCVGTTVGSVYVKI